MKPTNEQLEAYKAMAAASPDSMKAKIEANLRATCDKFSGHEDRLQDCMEYLTECARGILNGKNGEVDDDTCYRICRDYFNDELWKKEAKRKADKEPAKKTASQVEKESLGKERQRIEKLKEKHGCKADEEAKKAELEKMQAEALKKAEEKKINDKIHAHIAEKNKELGIGMAQPIDMFEEAV